MITHSVSNHPEPRWQREGPPSAPSRRQETRPELAGVAKGYQMPARHCQSSALRGQASDKPQGRKPRAGVGRTVRRGGAMGI